MHILIVGQPAHLDETRQKFGDSHQYRLIESRRNIMEHMGPDTVVFDFFVNENPSDLDVYRTVRALTLFVNVSNSTLSRLSSFGLPETAIGFCGMPTFLNRESMEVSILHPDQRENLKIVCENLQTQYQIAADQSGLVTPRVICMIINEAYRTVEEGIATKDDIDKAMKLGTNYPYGPFEWCERIGINHVVRLLDVMHRETGDERYKVCDLLNRESKEF
jgi:3-hydroxybutyryl-CoA dehydrogenase